METHKIIRKQKKLQEKHFLDHEHETSMMLHMQQEEIRQFEKERRKREAAEKRADLKQSVPVLLKSIKEQEERQLRADLRQQYAEEVSLFTVPIVDRQMYCLLQPLEV